MNVRLIALTGDGPFHVKAVRTPRPLALCGMELRTAVLWSMCDSGDVPLATTCVDCVKALDELEAGW